MTICAAPDCKRETKGSLLCRRCWRYVHGHVLLALHDHWDQDRRAVDGEGPFIAWAWALMERYAAAESFRRRVRISRQLDPDDGSMGEWTIVPAGHLAYVRNDL